MDYRDNRQRWAESHQVVHFYAGQWCTFTPALTGQVEEVRPVWSDEGELSFELELGVSSEWSGRIPEDSVAEIKSAGLLAAVTIDIRGGESREAMESGGHIAGKERVNLFAAMTETANTVRDLTEDDLKPLIKNVTRYVDGFGSVLETDGSAMVKD